MNAPLTPARMAALHKAAFTTLRPWSAQEFAELLSGPLVFATGGETAFSLGRVIAGEAELLTIATAPEAQRQGHAKACLAAFHAEARARGATRAFLEVAAANRAAQALYAHAGYLTAGQRKAYYRTTDGNHDDALIMARDLT